MKRTAVLCAGQGAQYTTMGKKLYEEHATAREIFDQADEVLGFELSKLCFAGDEAELTLTANAQPAILTLSYAHARTYFDDLGIYPVAVAGHSLGEYTALVCAGAMEFTDAVRIVRRRGELMQQAATEPSGMAAVLGGDVGRVAAACEAASTPQEMVVISNENSSKQTVISGHEAAIERATSALEAEGCRISHLTVSAPFHSPYMQAAADELRAELEKYTYQDPTVPVIANVTARPYRGKESIVSNLTNQLASRVRWTATMDYLTSLRITSTVEIGPKQVLSNLMSSEKPNVTPFSLDSEQDFDRWHEFLRPKPTDTTVLGRCLAVAVATRNTNFDSDQYRIGVVQPYESIRQLQEKVEGEERLPSDEEMTDALTSLKTILETKGADAAEQRARFEQIMKETGTFNRLRDKANELHLI